MVSISGSSSMDAARLQQTASPTITNEIDEQCVSSIKMLYKIK